MKIKKRILAVCLLALITLSGISGCSAPYEVTDSGFVITPGVSCEIIAPNAEFTYEVCEDNEEFDSIINDARNLVFDWWDDPSTFKDSNDVLFFTSSDTTIRGFEIDGYIFINADYEDGLLATLVHESIHLQNPDGFMNENDIGYEFNEMIVEAITISLVGEENSGTPTDNYFFFKSCPKLYNKFDQFENAYKAKQTAEFMTDTYGDEVQNVLLTLDSFHYLPANFFSMEELDTFTQEFLGITADELLVFI